MGLFSCVSGFRVSIHFGVPLPPRFMVSAVDSITKNLQKLPEKEDDFVCSLSQGQSSSDEEAETPQSWLCRPVLMMCFVDHCKLIPVKYFGKTPFVFIYKYLVLCLASLASREIQLSPLLQLNIDTELLS